MIKLSNVQIKEAFGKMSKTNISDYKFLSDFIYNKVGLSLNAKTLKIIDDKKMKCWGGLKCKQYPDELAKLLVFIYKNKDRINSYCEIGVERGGTFFVIDSFLRAINPHMKRSTAVDIKGNILNNNFREYKEKYNEVDFIKINSKDFKPLIKYDLCFIDGGHSYNSVKNDYLLMKEHARIIAFHDIKLKGFGISKVWESIRGNKIEFLNEDDKFKIPLGIGVNYGW
jgi:hypothetical protein